MVGDPSGRSEERNLLDGVTLTNNVEAVAGQLRSFLRFDGDLAPDDQPAVLVDNREWTVGVGVLEFLRDVGKHVTVGTMLGKESIRARLAGDQGISFTEFSYMLLPANDFFELHERLGCELQVGGSDQWGTITAGNDMIRRRRAASAPGRPVRTGPRPPRWWTARSAVRGASQVFSARTRRARRRPSFGWTSTSNASPRPGWAPRASSDRHSTGRRLAGPWRA